MPPSFIYSPLFHPFPPFLNRIFSIRTCVAALFEHPTSPRILLRVLSSAHNCLCPYIFSLYLSSHVSMLCPPPLDNLLFPLICSGCLAFYFVYPFLPFYQVFFLILLPLLSISFLLAFLLRCSCCQSIDAPLYDRGLSYSLRMRKCHCFLENILVKQGCFIYPTTPSQKYFLYLRLYFIL